MICLLVAIKDEKIGVFFPPYKTESHVTAERGLQRMVLNGGNEIADNPDQYGLYQVGHFNDETGEMQNEKSFICSGAKFAYKTDSRQLDLFQAFPKNVSRETNSAGGHDGN